MSIITRYLASQFLRTWTMAIFAFIVLFTVIDFIEKIGEFLSKNIEPGTIALFFLAQLPKVIGLMAPVATLIAILVSLAVLARNSEIVAFKAGGVSLFRLSAPFLAIAFIISVVMFLIADVVAPRASAVANEIWQGRVKDRLENSTVVEDVWVKSVRLMQHLGSYDERSGRVEEVSLFFFDEDMNLARHLEAKSGRMHDGVLDLEGVMEKVYRQATPDEPPTFFLNRYDALVIADWPAPPNDFGRAGNQRSDEMSVGQLSEAIDRLRSEGFSPLRQQVDLQFKFSFAMISVIMAVLGLPLAFWKEKGGSVALGLALGIVISFAYLIFLEAARSVGYAGLLPPILAAWMPNILFLLIGAYLFSYIRQ